MRATGDRDRRPSPYPRPANAPRRAPLVRNKTARRRYLGAASAVVVAGVVTMGFLGGSTATADPNSGEVEFTGKCGILGIGTKSEPNPSSLTVTEGDKVTFVNKLGTDGVLYVGNTKTDVEEGESKTVKLTNSTEAKMAPKCGVGLGDGAEKTTVTVNPKQETGGGDNGGGSDDGDAGDDGGSTGDNDNGGSGSDDGDSTADGADKPGDSPDTGKKPKAEGNAGDPNKGDDAKEQDDQAAAPGGSDSGDSDPSKVDAANKVSTESSASALLAALAALCLAGVGFAALRTYISGRSAASA